MPLLRLHPYSVIQTLGFIIHRLREHQAASILYPEQELVCEQAGEQGELSWAWPAVSGFGKGMLPCYLLHQAHTL